MHYPTSNSDLHSQASHFLTFFFQKILLLDPTPSVWIIARERRKYSIELLVEGSPPASGSESSRTDAILETCYEHDPLGERKESLGSAAVSRRRDATRLKVKSVFELTLSNRTKMDFLFLTINQKGTKRFAILIGMDPRHHEGAIRSLVEEDDLIALLYRDLWSCFAEEIKNSVFSEAPLRRHDSNSLCKRILIKAFERFFETLARMLGWSRSESEFLWRFLRLSSLIYESKKSQGVIRLLAAEDLGGMIAKIQPPIPFENMEVARKILETAGSHDSSRRIGPCIHDGELCGFAEVNAGRDVYIEFLGASNWQLIGSGKCILEFRDGEPRCSMPYARRRTLADYIVGQKIGTESDSSLRELADWLSSLNHGALLIVMDSPQEDCDRLCPPGVRIDPPVTADRELIASLTRPDGAVILDGERRVWAFGVILDGTAETTSARLERGARYHTAIRFVKSCNANQMGAIAFLKSEDRGLELIGKQGDVYEMINHLVDDSE